MSSEPGCAAGHAGSRIGWAIVGDPAVAMKMRELAMIMGGMPAENQARAANVLEYVLSTQGESQLAAQFSWNCPVSLLW